MRTKKIAIALLALGAWLIAPQAQAATPAPAWQLSAIPVPTNFAPGAKGKSQGGPLYFLTATNVGATATSGTITLSGELPLGLTPVEVAPTDGDLGSPDPSCAIKGQTVTCTTPGPLRSGKWLGVQVAVDVTAPLGPLSVKASISGGGAAEASTTTSTMVTPELPSFGFLPDPTGLAAPLSEADGSPTTQAGSHPHQLTVNLAFPTLKPLAGAGHLHEEITDLPRGFIGNPTATPKLCAEAQLASKAGCPDDTQVGTVSVMTGVGSPIFDSEPLYNMVPPYGAAAVLAFDAVGVGVYTHLIASVRSDGDYGVTTTTSDILALPGNPVLSVQAQVWGDPSSESHDAIRGACARKPAGSCKGEAQKTAFLSMPTGCSGPIATKASADSWEEPGVFAKASYESADLGANPVGVEGCNQLAFEPTIESQPTTNVADSPSGLDFNLHQPQDTDLEGLSTAALKDAAVTLPAGMVANPSQADGLGACDSSEIGLLTAVGETPIHLSMEPDDCPDAAKLGKVEVTTPLLAQIDAVTNKVKRDPEGKAIPRVLEGSVYLAKPFENPFGSLLAIYLVIDDPQSGTIAKLAGKVEPDPATGQLTTRFEENPQLPLEDVDLHLFAGARASLITPPTCATHTTSSDFTPWSAPEGEDAHPTDSFETTIAPGGGECPTSAEKAPNLPSFSAGTIAPQAGAYSPFVLKLSREDGSQRLASIDTTLAPGLTGKLAGIPYCSEAQIAQAQSRSHPNLGALEQASPSCPVASEVGTVDVAAGAGITPLHVQGRAYLSGPYKGAPLSLTIVTPAVAGSFDLGAVVVRTALHVNPQSAQIHAVSDPLPTILEGIPLDVRSIYLHMGRPQFTLNPTSCDPMAIAATTNSIFEQNAALSSPFQVGGCEALGFAPKLSIRLKGKTNRGGHPALTAIARFREGDANTKRASVTLPRSAFLDQGHIRTVCTRVQFAANACPAGSVYGQAKAITPLLDQPLAGPVYLRSSDHELPDLVIALGGQVDVELVGRVDSVKGGIRTTFEAAPDAPVSSFVLKMQGGQKGLLINSADLCKLKAKARRATVHMDAQNGRVHDFRPVVGNGCEKQKKHRTHRRGKARP